MPFRQWENLAEGQKSAEVKHPLPFPPPLRPPIELADWVEFLDEYVRFDDSEAAFGGGGREGRAKRRIDGMMHFVR